MIRVVLRCAAAQHTNCDGSICNSIQFTLEIIGREASGNEVSDGLGNAPFRLQVCRHLGGVALGFCDL